MLCEYGRGRLARTTVSVSRTPAASYVITMDPAVEDRIVAGFDLTERGILIRMSLRRLKLPVARLRIN